MARKAPDPAAVERGRRLGTHAGLFLCGFMAVAVHFRIIYMLEMRALIGARLTTSLWGDLVACLPVQPVYMAILLLGMAALGMSGFARREAENPAP